MDEFLEMTSVVFAFQDHTQADKLAKIQKDLDETKIVLHQVRVHRSLPRAQPVQTLAGCSGLRWDCGLPP